MKKITLSASLFLRTITAGILLCSVSSGIALYVFKVDIFEHLPKMHFCLFRLITGYDCPFCGTTRAFLALGQLNLSKAIAFNPLSIILMTVMILYLCCKKIPSWLQHKAWPYVFAFVTLAVWILRIAR